MFKLNLLGKLSSVPCTLSYVTGLVNIVVQAVNLAVKVAKTLLYSCKLAHTLSLSSVQHPGELAVSTHTQ